jgi:hypothetical protein
MLRIYVGLYFSLGDIIDGYVDLVDLFAKHRPYGDGHRTLPLVFVQHVHAPG